MGKLQNNQDGFAALEAVLIVVILGILGFTGWFVLNDKKNTDKSLSSNSSTTPTYKKTPVKTKNSTVQVPVGWVEYSGAGFKFAYPGAYTPFTATALDSTSSKDGVTSTLLNKAPDTALFAGISGSFVLVEYKSASTPVGTTKYGPKVKLVNGKWIITEVNPGLSQYKVSAEYTEFTKTSTNGLDTYTSKAGDEGGLSYHIIFVVSDHLYDLRLPEFDTGTYGPTPSPNDQKPYEQLTTQLVGTLTVQ